MAGFKYTVGEVHIMPTVAYLNKIVFVLVWEALHMAFVVIEKNLNAQRYRDENLARHVIPLFQIDVNITLFQHDNVTTHADRDTVNFLRANNIAFINDWPATSPYLNHVELHWDNLDQRVRRRPIPPSNVIQLRQALKVAL